MKLSRESWIIFGLGVADLATTLIWVNNSGAQEANPIFSHYLAQGPIQFAAMKFVMLAAPIFLLEWARRSRPRFTTYASRFAIFAYMAMYGLGYVHLNGQPGGTAAEASLGSAGSVDSFDPADLPQNDAKRAEYMHFYLAGRRASMQFPKEIASLD